MKVILNRYTELLNRTARITCSHCSSILEIKQSDIDTGHGSEVHCPCCQNSAGRVDFESAYKRTQKEDNERNSGSYWDR